MLIRMYKRWRLLRTGVKWISEHVEKYGAQKARVTTKAGGVLVLSLTLPETTVGGLIERFPEHADQFSVWPVDQRITQTFDVIWFDPQQHIVASAAHIPITHFHDFYRDVFAYWEKHHGI